MMTPRGIRGVATQIVREADNMGKIGRPRKERTPKKRGLCSMVHEAEGRRRKRWEGGDWWKRVDDMSERDIWEIIEKRRKFLTHD
jgi:hypothetical protein